MKFIIAFLILMSSSAFACSCRPYSTGAEALKADVIFLGVAQKAEQMGKASRGNSIKTTFKVQKAFKNAGTETIDVFTHDNFAACGTFFKIDGKPVLVRGNRSEGKIHVSSCGMAMDLSKKDQILRELTELTKAK